MTPLEYDLSAFVDYMVLYAIKLTNERLYNLPQKQLMLIDDDKALAAYIETPARHEPFGYTVRWFLPNAFGKTNSEHILNQHHNLLNIVIVMEDVYKDYMYSSPFMIRHLAKKYNLPDMSANLNIKFRIEPDPKMNGEYNYTIVLNLGKQKFTVITIKPVISDDNFVDDMYAGRCSPGNLFDDKRFYNSYRSTTRSLFESIISDPPNLHSLNDIQDLTEAIGTNQTHCVTRKCDYENEVVYDTTGVAPFSVVEQMSDILIQRHSDLATGELKQLYDQSVRKYTGDSHINAELLKQFYYQTKMDKYAELDSKIDECFNEFNKHPVNFTDTPNGDIMLFRLVRYIDPPNLEEAANMWQFREGMSLPNIVYTSTIYKSKHNMAYYNDQSQFRGMLYIIKCNSSKGLICINKNSVYPHEHEVLLHKRGALKITQVAYRYVTEPCMQAGIIPIERLVLYCDYIPPDEIGDQVESKVPITIEEKTMAAEMNKPGPGVTEWLAPVDTAGGAGDGAKLPPPPKFIVGGMVHTACVINALVRWWGVSSKPEGPGNYVSISTRAGKIFLPVEYYRFVWQVVPRDCVACVGDGSVCSIPMTVPGAVTTALVMGSGFLAKKSMASCIAMFVVLAILTILVVCAVYNIVGANNPKMVQAPNLPSIDAAVALLK